MEHSSDKLMIKLEGIFEKKEELEIEFDLYAHIYEETLKAIFDTIDHNIKEKGQRLKDKKVFGKEGKSYIAPLERSNIIALVGGRGSGKTTAINELCELLYHFNSKREVWESEVLKKDIVAEVKQFYMLPPIDASVLGAKEDLIEVILASMYEEFRDRVKEKKGNRDIFEKEIISEFDQAYKDYIDVTRCERPLSLGETVLVKLQNVSNSLKTRAVFDRLIRDFLRCMYDDKDENTYLVITIDDLDMNPENGYAMLEQLHKYLENLRVIVLIAVSYKQIDLVSQKHYVDCLIPEYGSTHEMVYKKYEKEAKKISEDYLLKVLPLANRVYLPEKSQLYLKGIVSYKNSTEKGYEVKDFILRKIAYKMGIFYDAKGLKKHFCLPNTVRELVSYVAFLDSLLSMGEIEAQGITGKKKVELYDRNHKRFNMDIENRMAFELLNDEQLKQYQFIVERSLERRAAYTVNFIKAWIGNREWNEKELLVDRVDERNYSYADLLEALYYLGRENYEDKVLVHCLLASFTSEMVREYYSYMYNADADAEKRAYDRLRGFRGKTFGGHWFDEIIPAITTDEVGTEVIIEERKGFFARCKKSYQEKSMGRPLAEIRLVWLKEGEEVRKIEEMLIDIVPYMECLSFFFYDFRDGTGRLTKSKWKFRINMGSRDEGKGVEFIISNEAVSAEFDFLGFIGRELDGENVVNYGKVLHREIVEGLKEAAKEYFGKERTKRKDGILKRIEEGAKEKSIWKNVDLGKRANAVFPYYDLDMSYNIMKRVKKKVNGSGRIKSEYFCDYLREIYGNIAINLKEEEEYYRELYVDPADKDRVPDLCKNFMDSPFIKAFGVVSSENLLGEDENGRNQRGSLKDKRLMNGMLMEMIKGLSVNEISDFQEHDLISG